MKKTLFWILGILAVLFVLGFAFGGWAWSGGCCGWGGYYGGWGMHGPGMMWGFAPFGWIGMLFMALIPLGFLALLVLGVVWLVRAVSGNVPAPTAARACPNCGKPVQADWQNCPYCGVGLK
ncbi:MAG: hypothetical protein Fur0043_20920 [Anaerolineales bacterium]